MRGRFKLWAGGVAAAGLLTLASIGTALAADPTPVPGGGPRGPVAGAAQAACQGIGYGFSAVSEALQKLAGMKPEDIQSQRHEGKSVVQIAKEKGVGEDALLKEVLAERKADLDEAVKVGRITQERADFMLKNMTERIKEGLNRTATGPRGGMGPAWTADGAQRGQGPGWRAQGGSVQPGQGMGPGRMGRWGGQAPAQ